MHMHTVGRAAGGEVWRDIFLQLEDPRLNLSDDIHPAEVSLSKTLNFNQPQECSTLADPAVWPAVGKGKQEENFHTAINRV